MQTKTIQIIKPEFHSDIYTQIKRAIDEEINLSDFLHYDVEDKKVFLFCDILKKYVFSYWTRTEGQDQNHEVSLFKFDTAEELLNYFSGLLSKYQDTDIWTDNLKDRMKETKLLIESKKANSIKELTRGKTTIKLNDILYTSWGYDQTNIEMFRVLKITGKSYFIIQEISQAKIEGSGGFMCCDVTAGNEDLNKLPVRAYISPDGYMSVCERGYKRSLFKHQSGEKHYKSWYA